MKDKLNIYNFTFIMILLFSGIFIMISSIVMINNEINHPCIKYDIVLKCYNTQTVMVGKVFTTQEYRKSCNEPHNYEREEQICSAYQE